jgi:hypothetical protein
MNKSQTIILDDHVVKILYNEYLSSKPFLVRIYDWDNEPQEFRLSEQEIKNMIDLLDSIVYPD